MAFFPRTFYHPTEASFTPLFRLLDDFDSYSRQSNTRQCKPRRRHAAPQWQPKFDVRETENNYELHGELPGLTKDNVNIEFSDPQTLVVRGKVERTYTSGTPPAAAQVEDTTMTGAVADAETPKNTHQASVEDGDDDEATVNDSEFEVVGKDDEKTSETVDEEQEEPEPEAEEEQKPVDNAKYWLTERSIGEFARSFHFPTRVEQDEVTASFKDGVLNITVPKAKKHESRRINID